ncbi:phage capsid protein [Mycobacterium intermedium]|uniref:Phage capsid protein n=1 Tax=Mycobacterium intermedium TaxID=28445 RepID=A0A1E3SDK4_MYCIE|nr:phage major capsid protein [Mycobacterium intermedium]MCV6963937.1 phage major capsid protein [Mycobacterium intermedium]ODR00244.1 phage capsid protein [Mycobacterium intermedium]OPE47563.1 phage capsid protein [Mycobacterium intermedium]ORB07822.1 phage capsid protein [Mycobacterium intermedium]
MASNTSTFASILTPEQVGELVIQPLIVNSVAGQVLTPVTTSSHEYRIPVVTDDPSASWTAEGEEIDVSDAGIDEELVTPKKLAALTVITRELANDSSPAAVDVVGQGIVRDLIRKTDQALFTATTPDGPGGIPGISGVSTVDAEGDYANIDPFSDAVYTAEQHNGVITAFVTNPATAMKLARLKSGTDLNTPLLQADPTMPGKRQILGIPLLTSPYVTTVDDTVWAVPKAMAYMVIREAAEVEADRSVFFTSDRVAVRAILRIGFGFPNPAAIVRITTDTGGS